MKRINSPLYFFFAVISLSLLSACSSDNSGQSTLGIQHWQTSNGMDVYFVAAEEIPMLDIQLVFDAGSARDGLLPGLAQLTTGLLDDGSGNWNADDIAARFEDIGAQFSASASRDNATASLRSLIEPELLDQALATFTRVITQPSFPRRDFERAKKQTLVGLRKQEQQPNTVAQKAFMRTLYGDHPYANPTSGTEEAVNAIIRQNVVDFHARYFNVNNAILAMVGSLNREQAEKIAERISASLPAGNAAEALPKVVPLKESKTVRIPFPSQQASVLIGQPGMTRTDDDYFPLYVGNHILGGSGFSSRILQELRSERGLVYSGYSYFAPWSEPGPFMIGFQTRLDQAEDAVKVAKETVEEFIDDGPKKSELESSVKNITGGFPLRIDSNRDILGYLATIGFYDLPLDYLQTFNANIESLDSRIIRKTFRKRLDVDHMITVIVGGEENQDPKPKS